MVINCLANVFFDQPLIRIIFQSIIYIAVYVIFIFPRLLIPPMVTLTDGQPSVTGKEFSPDPSKNMKPSYEIASSDDTPSKSHKPIMGRKVDFKSKSNEKSNSDDNKSAEVPYALRRQKKSNEKSSSDDNKSAEMPQVVKRQRKSNERSGSDENAKSAEQVKLSKSDDSHMTLLKKSDEMAESKASITGTKEALSTDSYKIRKRRSISNHSNSDQYPRKKIGSPDLNTAGYPYPGYKSSSYPYPSKYGKFKDPLDKHRKPKTCLEKSIIWLRLLLLISIIGNIVVAYLCMHFIISHNIQAKDDWHMPPLPKKVEFNDFVVTSSSETCNELLLMELQRRKSSLGAISAYMSVCLALAEPHNSGLGGHSISLLVDAKKETCYQTQGHFRLPESLENLANAVREDPLNADIGYASVAVATDIRNIMGLLQMENDVHKTIKEFKAMLINAKNLLQIYAYSFPVTRSLAYCFGNPSLETAFVFSETYEEFLGAQSHPKEEGRGFSPAYKIIDFVLGTVDDWVAGGLNNTKKRLCELTDDIMHAVAQKSNSKAEVTVNDLNKYTANEKDLKLIEGRITEINGHKVCSALLPNSSSVIVNALKKFEKEFKNVEDEGESSTLTNRAFYHVAYKALNNVVEKLSKLPLITGLELTPENKDFLRGIAYLNMAKREKLKHKNGLSYGGNMFSILDVKTQKAVVSVGSLGTSFGTTLFDKKSRFPINNLLSNMGHRLNYTGYIHHTLQPLIAMKNGKISLAISGPGGILSRSLDMARTLTTAALTLIRNVPLRQAITSPLIFPYHNESHYTNGFSYPALGEITRNIKESFKNRMMPIKQPDMKEEDRRVDRTVALTSDGKTGSAVFFDDMGYQMLPGGL